jgi:putative thioredoxin
VDDNITDNPSNIKDVDASNFMAEVIEKSKEKPVIVDFWAPWCAPCKQLAPVLEKAVSNVNDKISLTKINIDENQSIAGQLQIQSIPTVYAFYQGQVADGFQGNLPESEVNEFVKKVISLAGPGQEVEELIVSLNNSLEQMDWDNAKSFANEVLKIDNVNKNALAGLIEAEIGSKRFDKAKEIVNSLNDDLKNDKILLAAIDKIEISEKAFLASSEIEPLKQKLKDNPNDLKLSLDLAVALFGGGNIMEAYEILLSSIEKDSEWNEQAARKQLLAFFQTDGLNSEHSKIARRKLSSILFS